MKGRREMKEHKIQDLSSYAFKVAREHRERIAEICEQTGFSVNSVVNACIAYGLEHLDVRPVLRMGLVFDGKEEDK